MENAETRAVENGSKVEIEKTAYVSHKGAKPDAYMINDTFTSPDGEKHTVNLSFQNASPEEKQEWSDTIDEEDEPDDIPNPDPERDNMSKEEYSSLMDETDSQLPTVKEEFDFENSKDVSTNTETNNDTSDTSSDTESGDANGKD